MKGLSSEFYYIFCVFKFKEKNEEVIFFERVKSKEKFQEYQHKLRIEPTRETVLITNDKSIYDHSSIYLYSTFIDTFSERIIKMTDEWSGCQYPFIKCLDKLIKKEVHSVSSGWYEVDNNFDEDDLYTYGWIFNTDFIFV